MKKKVNKFFASFKDENYQSIEKSVQNIECNIEHIFSSNTVNIPLLIKKRMQEQKKEKHLSTKVAVFFDLEYINQSAITDFSVKTFCTFPDKFHVFTKFSSSFQASQVLDEIEKMISMDQNHFCIFDSDHYDEMDALYHYEANIFILGDSSYNLGAFDSAIKLYAHKDRNYLYFHDGHYCNLLHSWANKHRYIWSKLVLQYYSELDAEHSFLSKDLAKNNIRMIKPIINLTGCSKIIVNADNCVPLIEEEMPIGTIDHTNAYLPIPDYRHVIPFSFNDGKSVIVAHFGIPNAFKKIDTLIQAIEYLREQHHYNVKLLLAGYGVEKFVNNLPPSHQKFIIFEESPKSERMLALMKGADITVQLRWPIMGQSSGVISEMLGLGIKCITTKGFVNEILTPYIVELPAHITPNDLALAIINHQGKMVIPPEEHAKLLDHLSCEALANFLHHRVTNRSSMNNGIIIKMPLNTEVAMIPPSIKSNTDRKLRILYCASHRILRYEEVPLFIAAGFEVIPVKTHWDILKMQEPGVDNPSHPLYPNWRETCSIPDDIIEKIEAIDILKYQNLNTQSGRVSSADAALINEWIDIIYIPNLLPTVPRVLSWFTGLTLFRVYGEGKIMTYDEWAASSGTDLSVLRRYDARYATMLMLYALKSPEHASILGSHVFHVGPCVTKDRFQDHQWKGESASSICNTALSYIYENPHWTEIYLEFCRIFKDIPLRVLGKNNKTIQQLSHDDRVTGIIKDDHEYLELLTDCRCLLDPGTSPFHTHYTPLDAIMMGIPVIFLESSGMAREILRVIPQSELENCGMCNDFTEAKNIMSRCLQDIEYAKQIAANQRIIAEKMFSPYSVLQQIKQFALAAPDLVKNARAFTLPDQPQFADNGMPLISDKNVSINDSPSTAAAMVLHQGSLFDKAISNMKGLLLQSLSLSIKAMRIVYLKLCPKNMRAQSAELLLTSIFPSIHKNIMKLRQYYNDEANRSADLENRIHLLEKQILGLEKQINKYTPSFSQAGEDSLISFICHHYLKIPLTNITYLDIGANDPEQHNNTYSIYLSHGKGVLIEPNKSFCKKIIYKRSRDIVLNMGMSTDGESTRGIYYVCNDPDLNTFSKERSAALQALGYKLSEVHNMPLISFNDIVKNYMGDITPDLVSIDVEGSELDILKSIHWTKYRPKIFCIDPNTALFKHGEFHPIVDFMEAKDYVYVANTSANMIFVSREAFHQSII